MRVAFFGKVFVVFMLLWSVYVDAFARTQEAAVGWIMSETRGRVAQSEASSIARLVRLHSHRANIDPALVLGIIMVESSFRANARSGYGAVGLMQVVPRFHVDKIRGRDIRRIDVNIEVGVKILSECINKRATLRGALSCYSGYKPSQVGRYKSRVLRSSTAVAAFEFEKLIERVAGYEAGEKTVTYPSKIRVL